MQALQRGDVSREHRQSLLRQGEDHLENVVRFSWLLVWSGDARGAEKALEGLSFDLESGDLLGEAAEGLLALEVRLVAFRRFLQLGVDTLQKLQHQVELVTRPFGDHEKAVLAVLEGAGRKVLRRGEIHDRLLGGKKPSPVRVGQILARFSEQGLLLRFQQRAQGNPETTFFQLSATGKKVARAQLRQLGAHPMPDPSKKTELIQKVVSVATNSSEPQESRRVAVGWLSRECSLGDVNLVFPAIWQGLENRRGTGDEGLARDLCQRALKSRILSVPYLLEQDAGFMKATMRMSVPQSQVRGSSPDQQHTVASPGQLSEQELSLVADALAPAFSTSACPLPM